MIAGIGEYLSAGIGYTTFGGLIIGGLLTQLETIAKLKAPVKMAIV